jgi:predicted enzyme related to lactoylglutathione lyase
VPNPVVHFEITGTDGSALQNFYRAGNQDGATGGRVTVYAAVDDLQAYLDKAERLGANVVMPVTDMGDFTIALFADPAGNITGLVNGGNQSGSD